MDEKRQRQKKRAARLLAGVVFIGISAALVFGNLPRSDRIQTETFPKAFRIDVTGNPIERQTENACSAYAAAFVMRQLGKPVTGEELYPEIHRVFGFVTRRVWFACFKGMDTRRLPTPEIWTS